MFEGYKLSSTSTDYNVKIWKLGTILNALFIGCVPELILLYTDYRKGLSSGKHTTWPGLDEKSTYTFYQYNTSLFRYHLGSTIFAIIFFLLYFPLIILFFLSDKIFQKRGIYCKVCHILVLPCPYPCINIASPEIEYLSSAQIIAEEDVVDDKAYDDADVVQYEEKNQPKSVIYLYKKKGLEKTWIVGESSTQQNYNVSRKVY